MCHISAVPRPSSSSTPNVRIQRSCSSDGSASPAEVASRRHEKSCVDASGCDTICWTIVGTLIRIVGRCRAISVNRVSGVQRSANKTDEAPTENGKNRFAPVAYPKNSFGTEIVTSSAHTPSTPWPYSCVVLANDRCVCTHTFRPARCSAAEHPDRRIVTVRVERAEIDGMRIAASCKRGIADRVELWGRESPGRRGGEDAGPIARYEGRRRARVLEKVVNQIGRRIGVDHDDDRSAPQDAKEGADEIESVWKRHDGAFLRANVVGGKQVRVLRGQPRDVVIGRGRAPRMNGRTRAMTLADSCIQEWRRKVQG